MKNKNSSFNFRGCKSTEADLHETMVAWSLQEFSAFELFLLQNVRKAFLLQKCLEKTCRFVWRFLLPGKAAVGVNIQNLFILADCADSIVFNVC